MAFRFAVIKAFPEYTFKLREEVGNIGRWFQLFKLAMSKISASESIFGTCQVIFKECFEGIRRIFEERMRASALQFSQSASLVEQKKNELVVLANELSTMEVMHSKIRMDLIDLTNSVPFSRDMILGLLLPAVLCLPFPRNWTTGSSNFMP